MKAVTESFRMAKDSGFKVVSHMMPNLPNVDLERDLAQFKVILKDKKEKKRVTYHLKKYILFFVGIL